MTGIVSAILAAVAVTILVTGLFASVAFNSVPLAVAFTGASFSLMALFGAWVRLRGRFRFPRPRPLTGWRITAAAALSAACGTGSVVAGLAGSAAAAAVLAVLGAVLAMRCAAARRMERVEAERARRTERARVALAGAEAAWTDKDEAILRGDVSLPAWKRAGQADRSERT